MHKIDEKTFAGSCWNLALDNERVFVLLERDAAAPVAIRAWVRERLGSGKNVAEDELIVGALSCADDMERNRSNVRALLGKSNVESPSVASDTPGA